MKLFSNEPNFQFMNKRYIAVLASGIFIAVGVFLFFSKGFNQGIDFTGGTNIEVSFREDISVKELRSALGDVGLGKSQIQQVGEENKFFVKAVGSVTESETSTDKEVKDTGSEQESVSATIENALMTQEEKELRGTKLDINNQSEREIAGYLVSKGISRDTADAAAAKLLKLREGNEPTFLIHNYDEVESLGLDAQVVTVLKENTYLGRFTFLSVEMVGPQVGRDLRQKATLATVWAMIGMLIYIGFRFRFIFGLAAVITLLHDVLVSLTFILLFHVEVSLSVVAGILTIVGYSLNDTIVIFDRVRDNLMLMKREEAEVILDRSINQTLSRTIVTSGTTLCTVLALFFFGGEVIHAFSFTLLVGVVIGTYSSIFQSCAWLKIWEQKFVKRKKK